MIMERSRTANKNQFNQTFEVETI